MLNNKKTNSIYILLLIFLTLGCSKDNENSNISNETLKEENIYAKRAFTCQNMTVGISWPITLETTLHYCCVGDSLVSPGTVGSACAFVSDTTYEEIQEINAQGKSASAIHKSQLVPDHNPNKITISYSTALTIEGIDYKILPKTYDVDKDGYIVVELTTF